MRPAPFFRCVLNALAALLLLGLSAGYAMAQSDPPGRIGRLNYAEGAVTFSPAGDNEWIDAEFNRPLTRGDKLWTDKGTRAEIQIGSAVVRMDGGTQLEVLALDDQSAQLSVTRGTVYVRVRSLPEGENFEIDTPNLAYRASYPGDYRIDVDAAHGTTRVTIHSGTGAVYGDKGQALPLGGGQQVTFRLRSLAKVNTQESPPQDNFDRWAAERNRREDQSVAARYVPRDVVGYQLLDASGQWVDDATHGAVWFPQNTPTNWAPYRNGRWDWIAPWGWTWIDDAPWAFVTSHYGRWAQVGTRWAWVPGRMGLRPIYAPALVAFVGAGGAASLAVSGKQTIAWFPLAPGEPWQPGFRATPLYISTVNTNMPPVRESGNYAFQNKPEALTAIPMEDFQHGKPSRGSWLRVAGNMLTQAQVVAPPPMPERSKATALARVTPAAADIRQVNSNAQAVQQQIEAQRQAEAQAQMDAQRRAEALRERAVLAEQERAQREQAAKAEHAKAAEARAAEQAKAAEQARAIEQEKAAEQAKAAEQNRVAEQARRVERAAKRAEQQKLAEQARHAEQQKLAEQAKAAEQAQVAQQARAAEQAKIAEQNRIAQQARAAEQAKAAESARRAELARAQETARREATAKRAEQSKREQVAKREQARREQVAAAQRAEQAKREARVLAQHELQAKRAEQAKRAAVAKKDEETRRIAHAQQVEQARRAADHDAQVLREQRTQREDAARKVAEDKERAQREAWQRQQQALSEQWRRDQQSWEEQQRIKAVRQRPDLRRSQPAEPEVWQRGVPILNPGRTS